VVGICSDCRKMFYKKEIVLYWEVVAILAYYDKI